MHIELNARRNILEQSSGNLASEQSQNQIIAETSFDCGQCDQMARFFLIFGRLQQWKFATLTKCLPKYAYNFAKYEINPPKIAKEVQFRQFWSHWLWRSFFIFKNSKTFGKIFQKFRLRSLQFWQTGQEGLARA